MGLFARDGRLGGEQKLPGGLEPLVLRSWSWDHISWLLPNRKGLKLYSVTCCDSMKATMVLCALYGPGVNVWVLWASKAPWQCHSSILELVRGTEALHAPEHLFVPSLGWLPCCPCLHGYAYLWKPGWASSSGRDFVRAFISCSRVGSSWSRFSDFPSQSSQQREGWED